MKVPHQEVEDLHTVDLHQEEDHHLIVADHLVLPAPDHQALQVVHTEDDKTAVL